MRKLLVGLGLVAHVRAGAWDDFSNNLATDLAPFLSLFGEQITKQYISESISWLDYFIFAMAPMGILTAVVSAIRVCGSSSLRAFIGRAQEGGGVAEAELCSSTGRDVCELYNNGGIARVFGRPKILEVVHDSHDPNFEDGTAGIYTFQHYIRTENGKRLWRKDSGRHSLEKGQDTEPDPEPFAPNLSLNVGIQRKPRPVFWAVALMGLFLQAGVLVFAFFVDYYLRWGKEGNPPESYGCPLTVVGSILVCVGTYFCALLVGNSTDEQVYKKDTKDGAQSQPASLIWIQPGGQVIGDQTFDTFAASDVKAPLDQYIVSSKNRSETRLKNAEIEVWGAVGITLLGFILQFVGLRAIHSAVSVAQLGAIMVMSLARASLRMQRLKSEDNYLSRCPDQVVGHELDWLALQIGRKDIARRVAAPPSPRISTRCFWRFAGIAKDRHRLRRKRPYSIETAAKVLAYRTRLAELTESIVTEGNSAVPARHFQVDMVQVRKIAQCLSTVVESTANAVFSKTAAIHDDWKTAEQLFWGFDCVISIEEMRVNRNTHQRQDQHRETVYLEMSRQGKGPWSLRNRAELEALLGLWVWSLKADPVVERIDPQTDFTISKAAEINTRRIIATTPSSLADLKMWLLEEPSGLTEAVLLCDDHCSVNNFNRIWTPTYRVSKYGPEMFEPASSLLPKWRDEQAVRFFGWLSTNQSTENFLGEEIWSVPARNSFVTLCAQEVFACFLASIAEVVRDFGGVEIHNEVGNFRLQNAFISELTGIFTENGLGDRNQALLCLVPSIISRLELPSAELALGAARTRADQHRKLKDWGQAEDILRWAWNVCLAAQPSHQSDKQSPNHSRSDKDDESSNVADRQSEQAAIALGELYRWRLAGGDGSQFAADGIAWLGQQKQFVNTRQNTCEAIDRYQTIAIGNKIDAKGLFEAISSLKPYPEGRTALLAYLTQSERLSNSEKGQALLWAATYNWTEVISVLVELRAPSEHCDDTSRTALFHAVANNNGDALNALIGCGADPNHKDKMDRSPLAHASELGHESIVKRLIQERRVDLNAQHWLGKSPLLYAVEKDHTSVAKLLIQREGVNLNIGPRDGGSPLSFAAQNGNLEIAIMLLDAGATADPEDKHMIEALNNAAKGGHLAVVELLLGRCKVNPNTGLALWLAVVHGHEAIVKFLLTDDRVDPNKLHSLETPLKQAMDLEHENVAMILINHDRTDLHIQNRRNNDTALHLAARQDNDVIVAALLNSGKVHHDFRNEEGKSPLHEAALAGHYKTFEMLFKTGLCEIHTEDSRGVSLFRHAVEGGSPQIVELLLKIDEFDLDALTVKGRHPLHHAVLEGNYELFKILLGSFDPEYRDEAGNTLLHCASKCGSHEIVKALLHDLAVSPGPLNHGNWTPLHAAAEQGHVEIILILLGTGKVDTEAQNNDGSTPLHLAARKGHSGVVATLVEVGKARADVLTHDGSTPLHLATENGHPQVVAVLLRLGEAKIDSRDKHGRTPLFRAVQMPIPSQGLRSDVWESLCSQREEVVKQLLDHNADLNSHQPEGRTLLHVATNSRHLGVIKLLLYTGQLDADCKESQYGNTPLHEAIASGEGEIAEILLDVGKADPNVENRDGLSAFGLAVKGWTDSDRHHRNVYRRFVRLLARHAADVNMVDEHGLTTLHYSARYMDHDVAKSLLETGMADTEAREASNGYTPLHLAARSTSDPSGALLSATESSLESSFQMVSVLLSIGKAQPDPTGFNGDTPFYLAAADGNTQKMQLLLATGKIDADAKGSNGNTPLCIAAFNDQKKAVEVLIKTGKVDLNHKNDDGKTPLKLAISERNRSIERILCDAGAEL